MKANKHSTYHRPPNRFLIKGETQTTKYHENARFAFIKSVVDFSQQRILDIGCNTGFFLFEAIDNGARFAIGYEGSIEAQQMLTQYIQKSGAPIELRRQYHDFCFGEDERYDIAFLLNVVHHFGDDYGNQKSDLANAKQKMLDDINVLSTHCRTLIFQMGFNWHGDINKPIFPEGTKSEMIEFIRTGTKSFWKVRAIGVADRNSMNSINYEKLNEKNILRRDDLGEFLNRPIFIMDSKSMHSE